MFRLVGVVCLTFFTTAINAQCSIGCKYNICYDDGGCGYGCTPGYTTNYCNECETGYYTNGAYCCPNSCTLCSSDTRCTECNDGWYGTVCSSSCSVGCKDGKCDFSNGHCVCKQGYEGDTCIQCINGWYKLNGLCHHCPSNCITCTSSISCSACKAGFYGQYCQTQCAVGCRGEHNECNITNGKCLKGCLYGFHGGRCNKCIDGKWGVNCDKNCSSTCTRCRSDTDCVTCVTGYYGTGCQFQCAAGCSGQCEKTTGLCRPCKSGFSGTMCCAQNNNCDICSSSSECSKCNAGYYGHDCENTCPVNCERVCDKETGYCSACKRGFSGPKCDQSCSDMCAECEINGSCIECSPGWYGSFCNQSCPDNCQACTGLQICTSCQDGYFGIDCSESCPENCVSCISKTECSVCKEGFRGNKCLYSCYSNCQACLTTEEYTCTKCARGKYGLFNNISYCHNSCSKNCLQGFCDKITGKCTAGCVAGYDGDRCECPENCPNLCRISSGNCNSCLNGYSGSKCSCITDMEQCNELVCESCSNNTWYQTNDGCCKCSGTCSNNQCLDSSTCSEGCVNGYYGGGCQERCLERDLSCLSCTNEHCTQCINGFYPSQYFDKCILCSKHCVNETCDSSNGTCLESCQRGFWGERCDFQCHINCKDCNRYTGDCNVCENGRFMHNCSRNCSDDCLRHGDETICHIDNGQCDLGCNRDTVHGNYCELPCNNTCGEQKCDWRNGKCVQGCINDYFGEWCENKCSETCTGSLEDTKCSFIDGSCISGCNGGYFGERCESKCGANCVNKTCARLDGTCTYGCISGYEGSSCAAALEQESSDSTEVIAGAASGVIAFILLVLAILLICLVTRRRQRRKADSVNNSSGNHCHSHIALENIDPVYKNASTSGSIQTSVEATVNSASFNQRKPGMTKAETPAYENHTPIVLLGDSQNVEKGQVNPIFIQAERPMESEQGNIGVNMVENGEAVINDLGHSTGDTYYNVAAMVRRGLPVDKLADYVAGKSTDDLVKEFLSIPKGLTKPYTDSQRPENLQRNRYKGLYPYDENRVKLRTGSSDYINASYINGFTKDREYIAALGPTETTTDTFVTFWTMIWQENVEKIVMLTNLVENTKMKCEQYWPNIGTSLDYGDVKVVSMAEEQYAEFIVRTFSVTKTLMRQLLQELSHHGLHYLQDSEKRMLYHFHYTAWPDRGVPDDVTGLLEFRNKVLAMTSTQDGPVVVHCSAGIGRTGTYIALDYLTNEGEETGYVDIFACFANLRAQRVFMIQAEEQYIYLWRHCSQSSTVLPLYNDTLWDTNIEQYIYLHHAVVHSLTFDSKPIQGDKFQDYVKTLNADTVQTKFATFEFGTTRDEEETVAINKNSTYKTKNHPQADIPGDRYRPKLYMSRAFGEPDYINAVYLDSFRARNHYVVTQTPLKETIEDFFTLIFQEHFACVVDMQPTEPSKKGISEYLPVDNQRHTHGCFEIESVKVKSNEEFVLRRLTITNNTKSGPEQHTLHHYQYTAWNHKLAVPPNPASFINFVSEVESKAKEKFDDAKNLLHCISGAERSCLFCAVSVMLQKMESEQEVSVVNVIRQIRSRRPKAIPTKEQYLFCHQCVVAFLESFDTYSNFAVRH